MRRYVVCFVDDDRGYGDFYFAPYEEALSRRSNLRIARKLVSKFPHVASVRRCYVLFR